MINYKEMHFLTVGNQYYDAKEKFQSPNRHV